MQRSKIENINVEYIRETANIPKSRKQPKAFNGTQLENPATGRGMFSSERGLFIRGFMVYISL